MYRIEKLTYEQSLQVNSPRIGFQAVTGGGSNEDAAPQGSNKQPHVMIVDDDPSMRRMMSDYLGQNNMRTASASGRQDMFRLLAAERFNMIILDLKLGQEDGFDLLRELRVQNDLPVIIISGYRRDEIDRVVGLELGADDYITKPFSLRELLARIRVVLRRADTTIEGVRGPNGSKPSTRLRFGQWTLNRRTRELTDADSNPIALTKGEYTLLSAFLDAPQRPLSREHLLRATHVHEDVFDRSIDVQILRLRRKLDAGPHTPSVIRTERGVGYVFTLFVEAY